MDPKNSKDYSEEVESVGDHSAAEVTTEKEGGLHAIKAQMYGPKNVVTAVRAQNLEIASEADGGPRTATEKWLTAVWSELLEIKHVGVRDDFYDIGGHSLLATQVLARIHDKFGLELPLRLLFMEEFTVERIAKVVDWYAIKSSDPENVREWAKELDALSDEEVRSLLAGH